MRLAIRWLHEAGDPPQPTPRGGSMTLAIGWLHDGGETAGTWLHEPGDWQSVRALPCVMSTVRWLVAIASSMTARPGVRVSRADSPPSRQ
jgi:hypothetical protein